MYTTITIRLLSVPSKYLLTLALSPSLQPSLILLSFFPSHRTRPVTKPNKTLKRIKTLLTIASKGVCPTLQRYTGLLAGICLPHKDIYNKAEDR